MPWSKDDYPNSMKNLDPKIREKAIHIAEAMRKSGSPEGLAIATGIKKAKNIVKLAAMNFKQMIRPVQRNKGFVGTMASIGALSGASVGAKTAYKTDIYGNIEWKNGRAVKKPGASVLKRSLIGAAVGGTIGGTVGGIKAGKFDENKKRLKNLIRKSNNFRRERSNQRSSFGNGWSSKHDDFYDDFFKKFENSSSRGSGYRPPPPPPTRPTADHASFFKEYGGIDHTKITTKAQAKKIYKDAAKKYHPDMPGGNTEKFKKLSTDWESISNSPWFEKLAMIMQRLKWA